jgi:hypothetical protein
MNYTRYGEWVTRSFRWIRANKDSGLPHHIQMLGIVDAELRGIRYPDIFNEENIPIEDEYGILKLERFQIKAHLWVLGAYELVRMISQRVRENPELASDSSILEIQETKKLFERVRVPLAKLEASKRHEKTDFEVAFAGVGPEGLGWKINEDLIIYQEELSDRLFAMFSAIWPRVYQDPHS